MSTLPRNCRVLGCHRVAGKIREGEIERLRAGMHGGELVGVRQSGARIALRGPLLVILEPGPIVSCQGAVRGQFRLVQKYMRAVEGRQVQLVALHLTCEKALIAGWRQECAGDDIPGLGKLADGASDAPESSTSVTAQRPDISA